MIEPIYDPAVDVEDGNQLPLAVDLRHDGHHDLAPAVAVAGDVSRELVYVGHHLRGLRLRSHPAHPAAEGDRLASYLALEGTQDELRCRHWREGVKHIEACHSQLVRWHGECIQSSSPAQFTWLLGGGRDLKACQSSEAVFAKLLQNIL